MTLGALDENAMALVSLAAAIAAGDPAVIGLGVSQALSARVPALAVDELMLQSVLTVGWPRALVATGIWRAAIGIPADDGDEGVDYTHHAEWTRRGESTCRMIYGDHYDQLRTNVRGLHPALEAWMVTEGYGRTLARPGLALGLRELCTVAQIAVLRAPRQLHSHLLGALRAGASAAAVEAALDVARPYLSDAAWHETTVLWQRVRDARAGGA